MTTVCSLGAMGITLSTLQYLTVLSPVHAFLVCGTESQAFPSVWVGGRFNDRRWETFSSLLFGLKLIFGKLAKPSAGMDLPSSFVFKQCVV